VAEVVEAVWLNAEVAAAAVDAARLKV